ncbi:ATP-binding protein [Streptosporangium carneum]|uniref:Histidine kinase/HSP90-like ATPase domain-containing protein n=1 Tax=Streptosporangium carneum TaxID=47481 RepID=A0A9W6MCC4_9ACTN|nr:ATP-binding protein [Streptosporangium carneum]GLK08695.1 hypothetical protein GCM10017600_21000 [Streptosporangium carneum]
MTGTLGVISLPGLECSVSTARRYVADLLMKAGYIEVDDAVLLVSEAVTNAVAHTDSGKPGGVVTVEVTETDPSMVCIEVIDDGSPGVPVPRRPADDSLGGRGLWLVDEIAESWGFRPVERGRSAVWMQIVASRSIEEV